jgi:hypothetical protein
MGTGLPVKMHFGDNGGRLAMQVLFPLYCTVCGVLCSEFKFLKLLYVYFSVYTITSEMFILQTFNSKISTEMHLA